MTAKGASAQGRANGDAALLLVMIDVPEEHEAEFNRWYNEEHVPERMAIDGFLRARRYVLAEGNGRKYLCIYELRNLSVLQSDAYRVLKDAHRTEWTMRMELIFKDGLARLVYEKIADVNST